MSKKQPEPAQPQDGPTDDTRMPTASTEEAREAVEQQVADLTAALQRERADAVNLRRQHTEQLASASANAKVHVVRKLLPVIDNFERALKHVPADLEGNDYIKGIQGIVKQFEKTLADLGVARIKTVGEPFNPHLHEAISMEEGEGDREIVSEELQSGYVLGDDVLRHAMVRVKQA